MENVGSSYQRYELYAEGELGPQSSGVIHLANGMRSTFHMTEYNPGHNWKWVGPFLWLTIEYDHQFESHTRLRFVVEARGLL